MAVASLHWYLGSRKDVTLAKIIKALCRVFRTSAPEMQHILLDNILKYADLRPHLFQPYISDFFIKLSTDRAGVRKKKLEMLTMLASYENLSKLLAELTEYVRHPDSQFVSQCVLAVGRIASRLPGESAVQCLFGLMGLMAHPTTAPNVVADSVVCESACPVSFAILLMKVPFLALFLVLFHN